MNVAVALLLSSVWFTPNGIGKVGSDFGSEPPAPPATITALAVAGDPPRALTGDANGVLRFWDIGRVTPRSEDAGSLPGSIMGVAFGPDGAAYAVDDRGTLARVTAGAEPVVLGEHAGGAYGIAVSRDGRQIATCGTLGSLRLWQVGAEEDSREREDEAHEGLVAGACFGPEDLWTVGWDGVLKQWTTRRDRLREREDERLSGRELTAVAVDPDGTRILVATHDGHLSFVNVGRRLTRVDVAVRQHEEWVRHVAFSASGERAVATAAAESALLVLNPSRGVVTHTLVQGALPAMPRPPACAVFHPEDEDVLIVGFFDGSLEKIRITN